MFDTSKSPTHIQPMMTHIKRSLFIRVHAAAYQLQTREIETKHWMSWNFRCTRSKQECVKFFFWLWTFLFQVFIGETLSARVSHLHIRPSNSQKITKTKSSGLCVSTGTGSTSWHTSINRLSKKNVEDLLGILKGNGSELAGVDPEQISEDYNRRLVFEPGKE